VKRNNSVSLSFRTFDSPSCTQLEVLYMLLIEKREEQMRGGEEKSAG
jgi:hypothetical protein